MQFALWRLEALNKWEKDNIFNEMKALAQTFWKLNRKTSLLHCLLLSQAQQRLCLFFDSMAILGSDISRARMRTAVNVLGGPSKKRS